MIPFLVADRPISLSIIKGISLPPDAQIGILSQAVTTTDNFKKLFREYPYRSDVMYPNGQPSNRTIGRRTIKMVDSGIFGKNGCLLEYPELFDEYHRMGADFGVIIDAMRDSSATIESAKEAVRIYRKRPRAFKLVGVAQGKTPSEYFRCFEQLQKLGYKHIAIGGLLQKRDNTVRYVYLRSNRLLEDVLLGVRKRFDPKWLFALGVLHPDRIGLFKEAGVWGSDYKGWIFNYEKKATVEELIRTKRITCACRVATKGMSLTELRSFGEQSLRFHLTRHCIERRVMDQLHGRRLIVIACSSRKNKLSGPAMAWNLYDGVAYRMVKKRQREGHFPSDIDVLILSAKYGILVPTERISRYDQRMDKRRAAELQSAATSMLKEWIRNRQYREVFLWMGREYLHALKPFDAWRCSNVPIRIARGPIGKKLHRLKMWM